MSSDPRGAAALTAYAQALIRFKARQLSRKSGFSSSDVGDLEQDLTTRLLAKAHLYDLRRGSRSTFAARVINNAVRMLIRDRHRLKRGTTPVSFETPFNNPDRRPTTVGGSVTASDQERRTGQTRNQNMDDATRDAVNEAIERLSPEDAKIAELLKEMKIAAVARALGISRRQVYQAIERMRERFEDAGLGND